MNSVRGFLVFDDYFADLNRFILELVEEFQSGKIKLWDNLEERIHAYFSTSGWSRWKLLFPGGKRSTLFRGADIEDWSLFDSKLGKFREMKYWRHLKIWKG
jgi:hypothetical protein